jgi:hypothetical protein
MADQTNEKKKVVIAGFANSETDLGEYIFASNPYKAILPPKGTWSTPYPPPTVPVEDQNGPKVEGLLYLLDTSGIEQHEEPGKWHFKYAEHHVERAVRIPYMFYKRTENDDKKAVLVRDYFLIGFEGGGGY